MNSVYKLSSLTRLKIEGVLENIIYSRKLASLRLDYILLLLICLIVRLYHIDTHDLWGDEITGFFKWNLNTIALNPFSIRKTPVYILMNLAYRNIVPTHLLYAYNFVPRIPALIFGVLTVLLLYDAYKRYIGNVAAYIIGIFSCASYPLIVYANESRVYSMTHFFLAVYIWLFLSIMEEINKWKIVYNWLYLMEES